MTITTAILVSGVVSITLTPMLCSRFLKVREPGTEPAWSRAAEWFFQRTLEVLRLEPARRSAMASGDAGGVLRGAGADRLPV